MNSGDQTSVPSSSPTAGEENLTSRFIQAAKSLGASVELIAKDPVALDASLQRITSGEPAILFAEPDHLDRTLFEIFIRDKRVITRPSREEMSHTRTGVTDAFCGVAATGSVCVSISKNLGSPVSLLTRKHIAVVDASTIVARPRDLFSQSGPALHSTSRSFSFITGPSATADMGPLVIGVHGPGELHIIVLE